MLLSEEAQISAVCAFGGVLVAKMLEFFVTLFRESKAARNHENKQIIEYGVMIGRLQGELATIKADFAAMKKEHSSCAEENAILRADLNRLQLENTKLQQEIHNLQDQITSLRSASV